MDIFLDFFIYLKGRCVELALMSGHSALAGVLRSSHQTSIYASDMKTAMGWYWSTIFVDIFLSRWLILIIN